ncbi:MAG: Gfo/Idh/MocA family oxidoreductase [Paludisphaera borealis]|uniref:Gfo/Idh/MocA family protein n=1 Tax=Paludisphaera borealis TaxID=1387353 RepID=UPI00283D6946|nr:Gfo/Idh/MocA family oxidoreductase [Paludisphaera borealis]MDR3623088.1 Gfo/Idh/MocA family oxidoreductase [Paludisphaera borealis]
MTDPNRRVFLKASTAATAGLGFLGNAHARGNDVIKVGLVGCGGRGSGAADNICEAAGTSYNIKIHALGDVFEDHLKNCREGIKNSPNSKEKYDVADDRCFVGLDAYKKVIEVSDLVILATPPGFRPGHIEAVVKAGKNLFTEKPVAVAGTGIRRVLAAADEAKAKKLAVVAGTQRRHQPGYLESMKRIHEGAIGDVVGGQVYWNQGNIWAHKRQPGWSDVEYQIHNWYHFLWLCGDHFVEQHVHNLDVANWAIGAHPVRAVGMGGRQVPGGPEHGQSYDHFAVDYEYPNEVHVMSMARQIEGCENNVSETIVGSAGRFQSNGYRFSGKDKSRVRVNDGNAYVHEHVHLLESIVSGNPLNELKQVAESTLTAIMGRMSAYTGKAVTWEQALESKLDTFPKHLDLKGSLEEPPLPRPGVTELI